MTDTTSFPVDPILPAISRALEQGTCAVVHAPPGAGKTTRVPPALLDAPWLADRKIVMLEPRRIAAYSAARYMSRLLGEPVGKTVGYRIRLDTRVGRCTRLEVVTEGVLIRMIQSDPELSDIGCIIFDEFHERSLNADLALALALECRDALREDLRLVVMSATLDCGPVAELMGGCPVLVSEGRSHPVRTEHLPLPRSDMDIAKGVALAVQRALDREQGSVLAFLPGAGEIRRAVRHLEHLPDGVSVHPLYSNLPQKEQDLAIAPSPPGRRRVVLATSIAETSLTIEGIRVVVDSGLARVPRFDPGSGMTRLVTERVSRASADQRRGRGGRLGPGVCYRLWSETEDAALKPFATPEIKEGDLSSLALELSLWGVLDAPALSWMDVPPAGNLARAGELLRGLGGLDDGGRITAHGRDMVALPLHPRLAHMVLQAGRAGRGWTGCVLAALLADRAGSSPAADLRLRLPEVNVKHTAHSGRNRTLEAARRIARTAGIKEEKRCDVQSVGAVLALAYPDRVAQRTGPGQFRLSGGRAAWLPGEDPLAGEPFLAVADLDGAPGRARIWRAAPVSVQELGEIFAGDIRKESFVTWDRREEAVRARRQKKLGRVVLKDGPLRDVSDEQACAAVLEGIRSLGVHCLPWDAKTVAWRSRVRFLRSLDDPGATVWPDVSDAGLLENLEHWLGPFLTGITRRSQFRRIDLMAALTAMLPWDAARRLDREAPIHLALASGARVRIDYGPESGPVLPVKLQKMFGVLETPTIAAGRYPLTVHLLSPAGRPLQITRDLRNFWKNGYRAVKAEMKGRYPKHAWPDDPLSGS
jgi:ATP-dependent helicase HrpB